MNPTAAALYGKGVFTTIAVRDGKQFLWDKHWRRLTHNAAKIGIDLSDHSKETTRKALDEQIEKDGVTNGRARLTFSDESPSSIWSTDTSHKANLRIINGDLRPVPEEVRLTVSPFSVNSRSPLAGVKSCNYLENLLAFEEALTRGFHEAVRVNERGHITSGSMSNIFWIKDGQLYTPSLTTGSLPGTTREFVLENVEYREVEVEIDELEIADAIFLTSAGLGITQVAEYEGNPMERSEHTILKLLPATI